MRLSERGRERTQTSGQCIRRAALLDVWNFIFIFIQSFSYYLSSHHIDIHCWIMQDKAVPTRVVASAATGIATGEPYNCVPQTEDTITLLVDWESLSSAKHRGTAVYTASWTAPLKSGVHSAQHWYYMAEKVGPTPFEYF